VPQTRVIRPRVHVESPWVLRTERLRLRPLLPSDRAEYLAMLRESRAVLDQFVGLHAAGETDEDVFERQLVLARASVSCPDCAVRRVIEDDHGLVGAININDIQNGESRPGGTGQTGGSGEAVVWVRSGSMGKGYGVEAINGVASHALAPSGVGSAGGLGLSSLYALTAPANVHAIRAFARAGFVEAPGVPMVELNVAGAWRPHAILIRAARQSLPTVDGTTRETAKVVVRRLMASAVRR
jgi:RimJ/RimL family protein N-acetyltransferase